MGPITAKARRPSVVSRCRGTTSCRRLADRRRCRKPWILLLYPKLLIMDEVIFPIFRFYVLASPLLLRLCTSLSYRVFVAAGAAYDLKFVVFTLHYITVLRFCFYTRVVLGGKKAPTSLSRRTTNVFVSNCKPWHIQRKCPKWLRQSLKTGNTYISGTILLLAYLLLAYLVSEMTCYVSSGTLNSTNSTHGVIFMPIVAQNVYANNLSI